MLTFKANLFITDLKETDLRGANLDQAMHLTCDQVKLALIDKSTRLPDYLILTWSSESAYTCRNLLKKGS